MRTMTGNHDKDSIACGIVLAPVLPNRSLRILQWFHIQSTYIAAVIVNFELLFVNDGLACFLRKPAAAETTY